MATKELRAAESNGFGQVTENGKTAEGSENENPPERDDEQKKWNMERNWGFSLDEIFGLALKFFKEMNGKAFNPTYEENLRLVALHKQVSLGPYNPNTGPEVGFFDVLGNDRRKEWARLGSMAKEDAMEDFVKLLNSCCSLFAPYVKSHKIDKEEQERRIKEEEERLRAEREEQERQKQEKERQSKLEEERRKQEEEVRRKQEADLLLMVEQKRQIMAALNAQTTVQFQQYAQRQFPNSPEQQQLLIQQLQEQHYQQYIQQAYQVQQKQQTSAKTKSAQLTSQSNEIEPVRNPESESLKSQEAYSKPCNLFVDGSPGEVAILAPSMWTRPQIKEFKEKMAQDAESVITVGKGEVLTVRVPTHEEGSYLFWEFATDHYDIGFGLQFEWPNTNGTSAENQEAGQTKEEKKKSENHIGNSLPLVNEVVPIYRRDSHEEVYAGSHHYPGHGVYLLKFDNSYSLWRSKVVYYRVYYTR
ncbi:Golgi resident protein GCP60 isoform X2 [Salminus brasiliensis]|uniref:Golgi resident protein GCP60 isoform X2 n=1 Tax=Salminus brasiliensis TaxID=930266 RepID=UPI003B8399D9